MVLLVAGELSGDYFEDGRPSTSSFENQALTQSLCHMKGGATCLTCHSAPHDKHAPNEIQLRKDAPARVSANQATCQGSGVLDHFRGARAPAEGLVPLGAPGLGARAGAAGGLARRGGARAAGLAPRRKDVPTATQQLEQALDLQPYSADLLVLLQAR
ncbi:hypothetical protein [Hyalangium gracile]|uniref:hypothetical protein n=1 Tax=Hyalangium gracile TaxID=394092 RepID=UPI001CCDDA8C|nr:hypothetical protein [Hyalangium gracile]